MKRVCSLRAKGSRQTSQPATSDGSASYGCLGSQWRLAARGRSFGSIFDDRADQHELPVGPRLRRARAPARGRGARRSRRRSPAGDAEVRRSTGARSQRRRGLGEVRRVDAARKAVDVVVLPLLAAVEARAAGEHDVGDAGTARSRAAAAAAARSGTRRARPCSRRRSSPARRPCISGSAIGRERVDAVAAEAEIPDRLLDQRPDGGQLLVVKAAGVDRCARPQPRHAGGHLGELGAGGPSSCNGSSTNSTGKRRAKRVTGAGAAATRNPRAGGRRRSARPSEVLLRSDRTRDWRHVLRGGTTFRKERAVCAARGTTGGAPPSRTPRDSWIFGDPPASGR